MSNQENTKKPVDEAVLRRLAEGRLKGLETRRKRAEIKKQEKAEAMNKLNKEYQEKVLSKKETQKKEIVEESTDKEIYENSNTEPQSESEPDEVYEAPIKKPTKKSLKVDTMNTKPNYKQQYYQYKLERLQREQEEQSFKHQYARLPPYAHMQDIAKNQIHDKVNKEILTRVYNELFNG